VIDEVSMMSAEMLSVITNAAEQAEQRIASSGGVIRPCGVILTGDWLQLPPVKGDFAFKSSVWPSYENNLTQLTTIYRQTNPVFLCALNHARAGQGVSAVMKLKEAGVEFVSERDDYFDGTSLMPTNAMANKLNETRFAGIDKPVIKMRSMRWGKESGEWRDIPEVLVLKEGAKVMILANNPPEFTYVNGDCGDVVSASEISVTVQVERSSGDAFTVEVPYVMRVTVQKDKPHDAEDFNGFLIDGALYLHPGEIEDAGFTGSAARRMFAIFFERYRGYVNDAIENRVPYYSVEKRRWVVGWISYMPMRLAWASTIHKVQGLTLQKVQIDARSRFMGSPGMSYVALSRCRDPRNIRIVSSSFDFTRRIQTSKECVRWV